MNDDWADALVEGTLSWSFLREEDLPQMADLRVAVEYFDDPVDHRDLGFLIDQLRLDVAHAGQSAVVGRDKAGTIVAYAWNHPSIGSGGTASVLLDTVVHPAWRHRKIGRALVKWSLNQARMWYARVRTYGTPPLWIGYLLDEKFSGLGRALQEAGLEPRRWFFDMYLTFDGPFVQEPDELAYLALAPYDPSFSEQVRLTHNEAFGTLAGSLPVAREDWEASLARAEFHPEWSWLALAHDPVGPHGGPDHGRVIGYALNSSYYDEAGVLGDTTLARGWTERFGVCPAFRDRGVATALINASVRSFFEAGLAGAGLGVDTDDPEGAERLLRACGFTSEDRVILYGAHFS